mgnify:CR=1 FL=1|jgi:hypothetical protein
MYTDGTRRHQAEHYRSFDRFTPTASTLEVESFFPQMDECDTTVLHSDAVFRP